MKGYLSERQDSLVQERCGLNEGAEADWSSSNLKNRGSNVFMSLARQIFCNASRQAFHLRAKAAAQSAGRFQDSSNGFLHLCILGGLFASHALPFLSVWLLLILVCSKIRRVSFATMASNEVVIMTGNSVGLCQRYYKSPFPR